MAEALLIIDFQNDFTPGGALGVTEGDTIAGKINELAGSGRFDLVIATRDWHPADHYSFVEQGGPWPPHCVQGTPGAELHPALDRSPIDVVIDKGKGPNDEGYNAFEQPELAELLHERGVDRVTVVGLATDYCVKNSVLGALREGFEVEIHDDAMRAVNVEPGDDERAIQEMVAAGANRT